MAYSFIAAAQGNNGQSSATSSSYTVTVPTSGVGGTVAVGDTMILTATVNSGATNLVAPTGWRALRTPDDNTSGGNMLANVWVKNIDTAGEIGGTVAVSRADATGGRELLGLFVVRGSDAPLISTVAPALVNSAGTSHTTPAVTTTVDGSGLLSFLFLRVATAAPGPDVTIVTSGQTNDGIAKTNFGASPNYVLQMTHRTATATAGSQSAVSFTSSAAATSLGYRVVVPPSSGGGGGTAPTAAFTTSASSGTAPLSVTFTNTSTGTPTPTYLWDFGDGTATSTTTSPTHSFTNPGTYVVSLTATNSAGSDNVTATITVTAVPATGDGLQVFVNKPSVGWVTAKVFVNVPDTVVEPTLPTVPNNYFGMHVLGPIETNLNGTGTATLWPTPAPSAVRILNVFGSPDTPASGTYTGLTWRNIHTASGTFDWRLFDKVWAKLKAQGVTDVLYCLQQVPAWANGGQGPGVPPTNSAALPAFIQAIDARAKAQGLPIKAYEAWNEPNSGTNYWTGTTAQMVTLAQSVYNTVKAIDTNIPVLTPSPQGNNTTWMSGYLAAGGGQYADVMAFHSYHSNPPERSLTLIDEYKALFASYNLSDRPIWDTEAMRLLTGGVQTTDKTLHRDFLAVSYLTHWSKGVERFYWYTWDSDDGALWAPTTGINVAGQAYARVVAWLQGAAPGPVAVTGTVYSVPITRNGVTSLAIWDSSGASTYTTSVYTRATTLANVTTTISGSVAIGKSPILLWNP